MEPETLPQKIKATLISDLQWFLKILVNYKNSMPQTPSPLPPTPPVAVAAGFPPMIVKWANAIKQWEGGPDPTNPGDLKYAPLTATWGAMPGIPASDGGHLARFASPAKGFFALCNFLLLGCHDELKSYHNARTLGAFMTIYGGNPPQGYLNGIANALHVPLNTNIATFL